MKNIISLIIILSFIMKSSAQLSMIQSSSAALNPSKFTYDDSKKKKDFAYKSIISIYPLRAIASYMMAGVETGIDHKRAVKFIAGYATFEGNSNTVNVNLTSFNAFRLELQYKYFIGKSAKLFDGFYCAPNVMYKSAMYKYQENWQFDPIKGKAEAFMFGLNIGYQIPLGEMITLDGYIGQSIMSCSGDYNNIKDRLGDTYKNSIDFQAGLSFGIGF